MAMGRDSYMKVVLLALLVFACAPYCIFAADHVVGDSQGWGFSVAYDKWARGMSFAAGDELVFNYPSSQHNVVPVSAAGYKSCTASSGNLAKATSTGSDKVTLNKGADYFICSLPGHCSAGMKLQVNAH